MSQPQRKGRKRTAGQEPGNGSTWKRKPDFTGKRSIIRTWTNDEETSIADYISENPYLGKNQAKQTLVQYLSKLLEKTNIKNCNSQQMSNKYSAMKKKYEEVRAWVENTGQGVMDEDPEGFPGKVKSKCHYYYKFHAVFASSQALNTSYQRENGEVTEGKDEWMDVIQVDVVVDDGDVIYQIPGEEDDPENERKDMKSSANRFEMAITSKLLKNHKPQSTQGKIAEFLTNREENRATAETNRLAFEKFKFEEEMKFRKEEKDKDRELELNKAKLLQEVEMRKLEIERELQIKKLEKN